jgi:hypothetical protein
LISLLPTEHGAYGQIAFPLLTAFMVAGASTSGMLIAAAAIAGFLAHEPAAILIGLRGARARRDLWRRAIGWLGCCLAIGISAGAAALLTIEPAARWSIGLPLAPALVLAAAAARGEEKSWAGEVAAALAFSGTAIPVAMAAGATAEAAMSVAVPFALVFPASTLAVRVVILRVRRGGDPRATMATRRAVLSLVAGGAAALAVAAASGLLASSVLVSAVPGLVTATVIAARPPAPVHLRTIGWTLVAMSVITAAIVVMTA